MGRSQVQSFASRSVKKICLKKNLFNPDFVIGKRHLTP